MRQRFTFRQYIRSRGWRLSCLVPLLRVPVRHDRHPSVPAGPPRAEHRPDRAGDCQVHADRVHTTLLHGQDDTGRMCTWFVTRRKQLYGNWHSFPYKIWFQEIPCGHSCISVRSDTPSWCCGTLTPNQAEEAAAMVGADRSTDNYNIVHHSGDNDILVVWRWHPGHGHTELGKCLRSHIYARGTWCPHHS